MDAPTAEEQAVRQRGGAGGRWQVDAGLSEAALVKTLRRRTGRAAIAPWLWHLGLVEFCRKTHAKRSRPARRIFTFLRARDGALLLAAHDNRIPSEVLGAFALLTDAIALRRLTKHVDIRDLVDDRALAAFPISYAWAAAFSSPKIRNPIAALIPGAVWAVFVRRSGLPPALARSIVFRETLYGAVFISLVAELGSSVASAIRDELQAVHGARQSLEQAAEHDAKQVQWTSEIHPRLQPLTAARWAAGKVAPSSRVLEFIATTEAQEARLRAVYQERRLAAHTVAERIRLSRDARDLDTSVAGDLLAAIEVTTASEAAIDWLVEALCVFAEGHLHAEFTSQEDRVEIVLDADWFPEELLPPFKLERGGGGARVVGSLPARREAER